MELSHIDWRVITPKEVQGLIDGMESVDVKVGFCKRTIFHWVALWNLNHAVIDVLKKAKANPNIPDKDGMTPLHLAADNNDENPKVIEALLDAGADINALDNSKRTPIHIAASFNKNQHVMQALVNAKEATLNKEDKDGNTPLHLSVTIPPYLIDAGYIMRHTYGTREVIKVLLNAKANINAVNNKEETPLCIAIKNKQGSEVIRVLKEAGAKE